MSKPEFKDVQFMTAAEKHKVLRAWILFLKSDCLDEKFTKALYHHLSQHCSFIAHFDRWGFYSVYFSNPEGRIKFFSQFDPAGPGVSVEYGDTHWIQGPDGAYEDINKALRQACQPYLASIRRGAESSARARDLAEAQRLVAKHDFEPADVMALARERARTVREITPCERCGGAIGGGMTPGNLTGCICPIPLAASSNKAPKRFPKKGP